METQQCEWCKASFENKRARFCSTVCRNRWISSRNDYKRISEKLKYPQNNCQECGKLYDYEPRKKFCSHSCAAKNINRVRPKEVYQKQSETMKRKIQNGEFQMPSQIGCQKPSKKVLFKKICVFCAQEFEIGASHKNKKYCNVACRREAEKPKGPKQALAAYRRECAFDFALKDYPNEFDFELIKKYGWYAPKNHGNNLSGVSRDHMLSVREGYEKNISPDILAHPANCQLLVHNENVSKSKKSSISLEELIERIQNWDTKYKE